MFERNEELDRATDSVYALTVELNRGQVLTHEAIRSVLKCERHTPLWATVMRKVRRRLRDERGIATWPERTVGYKLLTVKETIEELPRLRMRKARSQFRRLIEDEVAIPERSMSDAQRRQRAFIEERVREARRATSQDIRACAAILTNSHKVPRRPALT